MGFPNRRRPNRRGSELSALTEELSTWAPRLLSGMPHDAAGALKVLGGEAILHNIGKKAIDVRRLYTVAEFGRLARSLPI